MIADLDRVLSADGWTYASSEPVGTDDPGRFHALFGRDALITALALMPAEPEVARATLRTLAAHQGETEDVASDEEPGKILHELRTEIDPRLVAAGWPVRNGRLVSYSSADATSWYLVVVARLGDEALTAELEDSWRAAADWLVRALARGGGLVRHGPRRASGGLLQQGWRDTIDPHGADGAGILQPDGTVPAPPLADADSQAVAVAALRAAAQLSGDGRFAALAAHTSALVASRFTPETMAVSGRGEQVAGAGSQLGWLLWADALPPALRRVYGERLSRPDVLTELGLRTLSSEHPQFSPEAYHRGAVWPFDSWLGWGGLRAAGLVGEAERVRTGVLRALDELGDAPELYAVTPEGPRCVPIANRVQAWTVGARWALEHRWDGRDPRR